MHAWWRYTEVRTKPVEAMTDTLDILERLVGFETVTRRSNLEMADYVESYLRTRGFRITRIPSHCGNKAGIYAEIGPAGDGIVLSGHMDVVPVTGQNWTRPPFRLTREDGCVFGRGTTDMKGYVAAMLAVADKVVAENLREPLKLVFSYDEEIGCVGIQEMLDRLAPLMGRPRACFVGEPTEMQVAVGHKGKAALHARCFGQSGHSALAPKFVNALHLASDFIVGLRDLQQDYIKSGARDAAYSIPYTTFHAGVLNGGNALNIVPDFAELTFEYRHLAADNAKGILGKLNGLAADISARYQSQWAGAKIEIEQYNAYPGLDVAPDEGVSAFAQKIAQSNTITKVAFGTEAGFFSELGIPTVVCGPGSMEGQGHKPDEFITLEQLAACDVMLLRILTDLSG